MHEKRPLSQFLSRVQWKQFRLQGLNWEEYHGSLYYFPLFYLPHMFFSIILTFCVKHFLSFWHNQGTEWRSWGVPFPRGSTYSWSILLESGQDQVVYQWQCAETHNTCSGGACSLLGKQTRDRVLHSLPYMERSLQAKWCKGQRKRSYKKK